VFEIEFYYKYAALDLLTPLVWLWGPIMLYLIIIKNNKNMTVQELIDELTEMKNAGQGDMELVLSITDHTDYEYNLDFPDFDIENVFDDDFDSLTDYCVFRVSI
jgi:hypothetical protein